ncbi:hypothetical protein RI367_002931 [Sorochytrium milnesiophthora]
MPATTISTKLLLAITALLVLPPCTSAAPVPTDPAAFFFDSARWLSILKKHTGRVHSAGTLGVSSNDRELPHVLGNALPAESHSPWTVVEHKQPVGGEHPKIDPADPPPFYPELPNYSNKGRRRTSEYR